MKKAIGILLILSIHLGLLGQEKALSQYVNPFVGASTNTQAAGVFHGLGKTFPGATTPYGMVQVSPNTITGGDNGSGYSYEHKTIEGFAFTQMSGVGWYGDLGNFLVMPTTGKLELIAGRENSKTQKGYRSLYDKTTEKASAGYYSVYLSDYDIKTECSATQRCGILRFTFPQNDQSRIQIDLARRVGGTSTQQYVEVVNSNTIKGWMKCTPDGGGWGNGDGHADYTVYFYAQFSKPLNDYGFWSANIPDGYIRKREEVTSDGYQEIVSKATILRKKKKVEGKHLGFFLDFPTVKEEQVTLKVGISFVDMEGARKNFEAEIKDKSFDEVVRGAESKWDDALKVIEVETANENLKTIFYTALYHTMIDPRIISDVDNRYVGGGNKIFRTDKFQKRTIFSGWDVFRSQFPLQTIINPQLVNDLLNSLITLAEESGKEYFERWELLNTYSGCMIGNPALSVLTDAYIKGIRDYNIEKAYQYAVNSSKRFGTSERGYFTGANSISETLEHSYFDWCLATLAQSLGKMDDAQHFRNKGKNYKNLYNAEINWFQPKDENGVWVTYPRDGRLTQDFACVESNPYQQGWFVPHDIEGMVEQMGGINAVKADLEEFFGNTPENLMWNNYYNHANEPVHHVPFIFNRIGYPELTQKWVRHICTNAYKNSVEGIVGNEDVGQMSAWYVLASIGIYPLCPGEARYEICSPLFDKVTIHLPNEKIFSIVVKNNSESNIYIENILLNNRDQTEYFISHKDILQGGKLTLDMRSKPLDRQAK